jgi:hypothetical protein
LYNNGRAVVFNAESEPSRVHAMQIWQTPFCSEEYASEQPEDNSFFGKIGNPELVRGISDLYSVAKLIAVKEPSAYHFNDLVKESGQLLDKYHWLTDPQLATLNSILKQVISTSELVLDEFEKVSSIKAKSDEVMQLASEKFAKISQATKHDNFDNAETFVTQLTELAAFKGELISHKELRYIDIEQIDGIAQQVEQLSLYLSQKNR